jgi:hypothetical protein
MPQLILHHQARADGGERTRVDCGDTELLHSVQPGSEDHDPAFFWFVDLRCEGDRLLEDPEGARSWFLGNKEFFVRHLERIANGPLRLGFDAEYMPYQEDIGPGPDGSRVRIVISAMRGLIGREMAGIMRRIGQEWTTLLNRLEALPVT